MRSARSLGFPNKEPQQLYPFVYLKLTKSTNGYNCCVAPPAQRASGPDSEWR